MALPTSTDVSTLDYSYNGMPFGNIPTTNLVDTFTMDYSYNGMPFVTNPAISGPANIGGFDGVTSTNLQAVMGVTYTNLETINGVT